GQIPAPRKQSEFGGVLFEASRDWRSLLTTDSDCPSGRRSPFFRRISEGMSEKSSSIELAPTLRSISSIISWSRLGKSGWESVNGSFFIIILLRERRKTIKISITAALAHSMRGVFLLAAILILLVALPYGAGAQSQEGPVVTVTNQYIVNRYGYAVMN